MGFLPETGHSPKKPLIAASLAAVLAVLGRQPALAENAPQRRWGGLSAACREEAARLCGKLPEQGGLLACVAGREAELSGPCREEILHRGRRNRQFRDACEDDMARLCASVEPGNGRRIGCLLEHGSEVSEKCRAAIPDVSAPLPSASTQAAPGAGSFFGREEAEHVARLLSGTTEGLRVDGLLGRLRRNPEDLEAQWELRRTVLDLYVESLKAMKQAGGPDPPGSGPSLRRDAFFRFLIQQVAGKEVVRNVCLEGPAAFEAGRYLLARDRLALCELLGPRQPWLRRSLWLYGRILDGLAGAPKSPSLGHAYFVADQALGASRWQTALDMMKPIIAAYEKEGDPDGRLPELLDLRKSLLERVSVEENIGLEGYEERLKRTQELAAADPARAVNELEALIAVARLYSRPMVAERAKVLLRWAYSQQGVQETMRQAARAYESGNSTATARLLVQVLEKDPKNKDALAMIKRSSPKDSLQAEAYYNRGLSAYLDGDLGQAEKEWRESLKLDSGLDKSRKALERVLKELKLSKKDAPGASK